MKFENDIITFPYNINNGIYAGCQTETRPDSGAGIDLRNYKMIKASLNNKGSLDVHCNIIYNSQEI